MRQRELRELIDSGESTTLEFKRKVTNPKKIAKEISAFANTKGGFLLIGVDDDGTLVGVASEKSELDIVMTACQFLIEPAVEPSKIDVINIAGREIVVVEILSGERKPYKLISEDKLSGKEIKRAYIRIGEKSVIASKEMVRLMKDQSSDKPVRLSIGHNEKRLFRYLESKEKATVKDFSRLVNISERRAERLMIRLVRAGVLQIHNDATRDYFTLI